MEMRDWLLRSRFETHIESLKIRERERGSTQVQALRGNDYRGYDPGSRSRSSSEASGNKAHVVYHCTSWRGQLCGSTPEGTAESNLEFLDLLYFNLYFLKNS